jgi:hypothetical protein
VDKVKETENAIDQFAQAARAFCSWLEEDPYDDASERYAALCLLSGLYSAAVRLPQIPNERLRAGAHPPNLDKQLTEKVMNRLDRFPKREYWRIEKTAKGDAERVDDDIARDLFLTYSAVKSSLLLFDQGKQYCDMAVWSWLFSFWLDWGGHSTNAIQALHSQFHEELSRDE